VSTLSDYFDAESIRRLQQAFSAILQCPVEICPEPRWSPGELYTVPITLHGRPIGAVGLHRGYLPGPPGQGQPSEPETRSRLRFLDLTASLLGRLCEDRHELRRRAEQLATLYKITADFAAPQDLKATMDTVAQTVVRVMGAKACSIRLLSEDRSQLVVQAVANLSPQYLAKGPILISQSKIDREVLETLKPVYIADERTDPRVLYPAEARREGIVSALCAPIVYKDRVEGVIRVYTGEPHEFDWFETSLLEAIAAQAAAAVVNTRLRDEALASANMRRALATAGEVQRRMIPQAPPQIAGFDIAAVYVPTYELSGDFYDFIPLQDDSWGLVVCDVVGKGVRASLLMSAVRAALRAHAAHFDDVSTTIEHVNYNLSADTTTGDFATLFYGALDPKRRRITYANAGHIPPVLIRQDGTLTLSHRGGVLGIDSHARWASHQQDLETGDVLLMYTDGLSDAMNFKDEPFGHERIRQAAIAAINEGRSADSIARHIVWTMRTFCGLQTRFDDLTLLVVRVQ